MLDTILKNQALPSPTSTTRNARKKTDRKKTVLKATRAKSKHVSLNLQASISQAADKNTSKNTNKSTNKGENKDQGKGMSQGQSNGQCDRATAHVRKKRRVVPRSPHQSPSIHEVAQRAGVSIATVSNVLSGKEMLFTPQTGKRVLESVRELGYQRNSLARSLVQRRTSTLGLAAFWRPHTRANTFLSALLYGFIDGAADFDYQVKVVRLNGERPEETIRHLEDGSMDGVVIMSPRVDSCLLRWTQNTKMPTLITGCLPPLPNLNAVGLDDVTTMKNATLWLMEQGHRHIALLRGEPSHWSAQLREQGYRAALQEKGITFRPNLCVYSPECNQEALRQTLQTLMSLSPRPTVVACYNDWQAMATMTTLQSLGLRVPDDVSVLGFNDEFDEFAKLELTTVSHPVVEIGVHSAHLLIERIKHVLTQNTSSSDTNSLNENLVNGDSLHALAALSPTILPFLGHVVVRESVARIE